MAEADVLDVADRLGLLGRGFSLGEDGEQDGCEDCNDGNNYEEFN